MSIKRFPSFAPFDIFTGFISRLTFKITYYPSDGFHGFKYSLGYVSALNAKSVLAKGKNALA